MSSLEEDVRAAASALAPLIPHSVRYGEQVADRLRSVCAEVEPALKRNDLVLAVVGDVASRRTLLRAILGDAVIRGSTDRRSRVLRVRLGETLDYVSRDGQGQATRFTRLVPDREATYQAAIERAEAQLQEAEKARTEREENVKQTRSALATAEGEVPKLDEQLEAAGQVFAEAWRIQRTAEAKHAEIEKAAPDVPPLLVTTPAWWAFWLWIIRWVVAPKYREPLALHAHNRAAALVAKTRANEVEAEARRLETARDELKEKRGALDVHIEHTKAALAQAEVELADEAAVAAAKTRLDTLLRDRSRHAGERKDEFFAALRDIDGTAKGDSSLELDIELPAGHPGVPPKDVTLVFADAPPQGVDGFVLVGRQPPPSVSELRTRLPQAAALTAYGADFVRTTLERARDKKTVIPMKLALGLRACIADIAKARTAAEDEHKKRLESLEKQRIPHPDDFRARQLARSESAVEKGADEVLAAALDQTGKAFEALGKRWAEEMARETSARGITTRIRVINEGGKVQVLELIESTCELIVREMQTVGESLERWALDEIQASYHTVKRRRIESLVPVASDVTSEDLAAPIATVVPVRGARESFQRQRVLFALGGCASAAAIGTLVRPGIGTAIGAVVGLLALLLKSPAQLRARCLVQLDAYTKDATAKVQKTLRDKRGDIAAGIRAALDDALADTLERLNETITRLMKVERDAIEAEERMLSELHATRGTLETHDERLRAAIATVEGS